MHYLTKVLLSPVFMRREKIEDDYALHRAVYSFFPPESEAHSRFLYADRGAVPGGRAVLLLSEREPQLPDDVNSSSVVISESFFSFRNYRFEVELNPVKRSKSDGKRRAVTGQLDLLQWFIAHAPKWGFEADTRSLEVYVKPTRHFSKAGKDATFNRALFKGRLTVTEPELFQSSFYAGLGHGKAFGFGLLQLLPLNQEQNR